MKQIILAIAFVLFIAFAMIPKQVVTAGWFGCPKNYDECVLESMKGVTSDVAAREIRNACRRKFPSKSQDRTNHRKLT